MRVSAPFGVAGADTTDLPDSMKRYRMTRKPLKLSDTTFRDAHQSLMATRFRTEDMIPLAADMDSIGFFSMEVWGGATFDSATRFLAEDPWERLRSFKSLMPNTRLSMLLRGQSLVGYRNYADDVVDKFVERSAENGIDIFRVFDALNYEPNIVRAADAVKSAGSHLQLAICYTIGEGERMGGDIYNLEYYLSKARSFRDLGADSICIKDMGGLLAPYDAFDLVTAIKSEIDLPLQLHAHYTSGMASMTALKAVEAGLDILDVCLAPLALRTSQPAVEPIAVTLLGTDRDPGVDLESLLDLGDRLEEILPKYADHLETTRSAVIDARVLSHQIPGGMASNMVSQLREADALDRMSDVMEEIPRTRADLGFPPLVTPMSQMVGAQAVNNVIFGRYTVVSEPVKEYLRGNYGKPVSPVRDELMDKLAESEEISPAPDRPGAVIEPELETAKEAVSDLTDDIDDALIYALYPQTGERFLRIKHGLEPVPDEMKPRTQEEVSQAAKVSRQPAAPAPPMSANARRFNIYVGDQFFEIDVDPVGTGAAVAPIAASAPIGSAAQAAPAQSGQPEVAEGETAVVSPMPGILISMSVEEGETVAVGDPLLVLEAMKMQNTIPSPVDGTIKSLPVVAGTQVVKDQVLAVIQS